MVASAPRRPITSARFNPKLMIVSFGSWLMTKVAERIGSLSRPLHRSCSSFSSPPLACRPPRRLPDSARPCPPHRMGKRRSAPPWRSRRGSGVRWGQWVPAGSHPVRREAPGVEAGSVWTPARGTRWGHAAGGLTSWRAFPSFGPVPCSPLGKRYGTPASEGERSGKLKTISTRWGRSRAKVRQAATSASVSNVP